MAKSPVQPVKGAGTTLWIYTGIGDPYANPVLDIDWTRLAKLKELTPGDMTAESYDDTYLDDEDADWTAPAQGTKSAGDTSLTLAWKPGESGQKDLVAWFNDGSNRAYKIKYPNGAVDVFRGWVSSLGKAIPTAEVITRTLKITNVGKPTLAEEQGDPVVAVTGVTLDKTSDAIGIGDTGTAVVTINPAGATDKAFRFASSKPGIATVTADGTTLSYKGVAAGTAEIIVMTNDGQFIAQLEITVS